MRALPLHLLAALALLPSCDGGPLGSAPGEEVGTRLTGADVGGLDEWWRPALAWSPDGREVFYAGRFYRGSTTHFTLTAVDVATRATRVVHRNPTHDYRSWRLSADGRSLYYHLSPVVMPPGSSLGGAELEGPIYRVPAAGGAAAAVVARAGDWFALSPDDRLLAHTSTEERAPTMPRGFLYLHDLATGSRARPAEEAVPIAFSPDAAELAVGEPFSFPTYRVVPLRGGEARVVWSRDAREADLRGLRWVDGRLALLSASHDGGSLRLSIHDPGAGTSRALAALPAPPPLSHFVSWSPSGRRVAVWISGVCTGICVRAPEHALHLVDASTGAATRLAGARFGAASYPVFSPDERRLAFSVDGAIYVRDLP